MILPVRIEPITDAQKEPREIYAYYEDEVRRVYFAHNQWLDCETACPVEEEPKFYLPDGLPSPDQAVEVFEAEVFPNTDRDEKPIHDMYSERTPEELPFGTKVGVYKLPEVQNG